MVFNIKFINGAERVIVNQIVRSPGVYYKSEIDKNGRRTYSASLIPNRGAWLKFETDRNDLVWVRIDKTRKLSAQVLLKALGLSDNEIFDAGSCGEVRISLPSSGDFTGLKVDGTAINAATLPSQTLPSCVSGTFSEARTANFKTPTGQVVVVGKTPGAAVAVTLPSPTTRNVTVNACGFGVLKGTSTSAMPATFMVGTTSYTVATLPDATTAPYCRTIDGTPYGYVPASW